MRHKHKLSRNCYNKGPQRLVRPSHFRTSSCYPGKDLNIEISISMCDRLSNTLRRCKRQRCKEKNGITATGTTSTWCFCCKCPCGVENGLQLSLTHAQPPLSSPCQNRKNWLCCIDSGNSCQSSYHIGEASWSKVKHDMLCYPHQRSKHKRI